jgi:hypothetical protein
MNGDGHNASQCPHGQRQESRSSSMTTFVRSRYPLDSVSTRTSTYPGRFSVLKIFIYHGCLSRSDNAIRPARSSPSIPTWTTYAAVSKKSKSVVDDIPTHKLVTQRATFPHPFFAAIHTILQTSFSPGKSISKRVIKGVREIPSSFLPHKLLHCRACMDR